MNNRIIQSIHHEHGENILNGIKRYEIRKTAPKSGNFPYIYTYMKRDTHTKAREEYCFLARERLSAFMCAKRL